jgi:hypothetical protein
MWQRSRSDLFKHGREKVVMLFLILEDFFEYESCGDIRFFLGLLYNLLITEKP